MANKSCEEKLRVSMDRPKQSQGLQCLVWQGNSSVLVSFSVPDVDVHAVGVDITNR